MQRQVRKRVAVLGGGLQGCCLALALAARGAAVTIFDRNDALLTRAGSVNEGKIHLGYIYAGDRSFATARMMMQGAFSFAGFIERHIGVSAASIETSSPAVYVVHKNTAMPVDEVERHLNSVAGVVRERAEASPDAYFGADLTRAPRRWSPAEFDAAFDPDAILAAFDTNEIAVRPAMLAELIKARIAEEPSIELRLGRVVDGVRLDGLQPEVLSTFFDGAEAEAFDDVVNALWDGRLALDAKLGLHPNRPWLHRFKYGVRFQLPDDFPRPPSVTFVFGSFGELVSFDKGSIFLTWYPTCMVGSSPGLEAPDFPTLPDDPLRSRVLETTYEAMSSMVLGLRGVPRAALDAAVVKGGVIVAWGKTDIDDPQSELHNRFELGLTSVGQYHTLDPGKYTLAPYFAEIAAERIMPA